MPENRLKNGCCMASRGEAGSGGCDREYLYQAETIMRAEAGLTASLRSRMCRIPGGIFEMGARRSTFPDDMDSPRRKVKLDDFLISPFAVTNAEYAAFVDTTGYRTVAETEGWSFVFHLLLPDPDAFPESPPGLPWWRKVDGAYWAAPEGPSSSVEDRPDHPAVHLSWYDALAYCNWSGLRLPTEAEWERAARGGLVNCKFPWGNEIAPNGEFAMNTFQGNFPYENSVEDGYLGTAPVDAFRPNLFGLYNMTGNVWEWVFDRFGPLPVQTTRLPPFNPAGSKEGYARTQRGGSYLCHVSYCDRYHVHSRTRNDPDSSTGNAGFRVAASL